jgi:NitT/TauT family transport system ATP-binding protein
MNVAPRLTSLAGGGTLPALLELDHVSISYPTPDGVLTAVENVSFNISAGERLVLLGPSGCGKSTLLRAVGGFLKPSAGELRINGRQIGAPGPDRMTVFQEFDQLLPWRTVLGNVRYALERGKSLPRRDAEGIARRWLERVGLKNFVDAFPHTLSGGMKQRVAIARAFALEPALLLMDEPFAALDEQTRMTMGHELLRIWSTTSKTVVFITHSLTEAVYLADEVLVMSARPGRIIDRIQVDLPRPRNYEMMATDVFGRLRDRIWRQIRKADA